MCSGYCSGPCGYCGGNYKTPGVTTNPDFFWMIYVDGGGSTKKHYSHQDAMEEAARLSRNNNGRKVYILQTVEFAKTEVPKVNFTKLIG